MKKIITAINNPKLNEELKKENKFEIIGKDIQYKEAILEILEQNNNIDLIIINEKIPGEINIEKLIKKIKLINEKIKLIFILENENKELEKILNKNNINEIYYNNKINLNDLINLINKKEINMEEEIIKLKKIIEEKNLNNNFSSNDKLKKDIFILKDKLINKIIKNKKENNKIFDLKNKFINQYFREKKDYINKSSKLIKPKIITFSGNYKSGKTTLSLIFANYFAEEKKKVLLVDMDLEKQDLNIILKKEKYLNKIKRKINDIKNISWKDNNIKKDRAQKNLKNRKDKKEILNNVLENKNFNNYFNNKKIINKNKINKLNKNKLNKNKSNKNKSNKINYKKIKLNKNKYKKLINKKNNINYFKIKKLINLFIFKINKNFYLFNGINILLNNKKYKAEKNYKSFFKLFFGITKNKKFDFIIIDMSKNNSDKINKEILKNSDVNFLVFKSNMLGVKEFKALYNKYEKEFKIQKKSLHIIENMHKFNSINKQLIRIYFPKIKNIFLIEENKKFNILINNYYKNNCLLKNKKTKNKIYKIIKKLE